MQPASVFLSAAAHLSPRRGLHSVVASQPSLLGLLPPLGSAAGACRVLHPLLMTMTSPERSVGQNMRTGVTSSCNWPAGHLCPEPPASAASCHPLHT